MKRRSWNRELRATVSPNFLFNGTLNEIEGAALFLYAAYWAFAIRRASAVPLYRNQALGLFLVAFSVGIGNLAFILNGSAGNLVTLGIISAGIFFFFYWVDASVLASRRSDPLMRDTFRWSRLRLVLWPINVLLAIIAPVATFVTLSPIFVYALLVYVVGAASLTLAARRSGDPTFRRHLKWFGLYAVSTLLFYAILISYLTGVLPSISGIAFVGLLLILVATFAQGYSLYRSATSLVPLRSLPEEVRLQGN